MNDFSNNHCLPPADSSVPNLQVIRMTLLCDSAPAPITMDLTGMLPVHPPPSGYSSPSSVTFLPNPVMDVVWWCCALPLVRRHGSLIFPGAKHLTPVAAAVCVCVERLQWVCPCLREKRQLNVCLLGNIEILRWARAKVVCREGERGSSKCVCVCD